MLPGDSFDTALHVCPRFAKPAARYYWLLLADVDVFGDSLDCVVHTNGMENYWSLLKRTIKGTYVSIEPFHLFRYLDEQAFRFNNRKGSDAMRFAQALRGILNKRLTYTAPTGAELSQTC